MTDYADELLGGPQTKTEPAAKYDYAEILNAPDAPTAAGVPDTGRPQIGFSHKPASGSGMGFIGGLKAGIPSDPQARLKIVADTLFPGDPNGMKRVGMKAGRLVFVNNKGDVEYADSGVLTTLGGWAANLPEIGGSVIGSLTPAGPVAGAAVGGVAGKGWKMALSNLLFDEPQTVGGNAAGLAKEGAINAVTGGLAKGVSAIYGRSAVRNAENFDKAKADALIDRVFQKTGIKLDYAQAGNLPQLRNLKKWAAKYPSEAQDIIETMDREQADQVANAIETKILGRLSKESDPAALASSGVNAAKAAIELAKAKRSSVVQPLYEKAYKDSVDVTTLAQIKKADPVIAQTLRKVRGDKLYQRDLAGAGENSIRTLDLVKRNLDDQIGAAQRAGENNRVRILTKTKDDLLTFLDAHSPAYKTARAEYGKQTKALVEPLENGTLGILAKIEGPKMAQLTATVMDDVLANPQATAAVKLALTNGQGPQAWNDVLKLSLSKAFNKASKETQAGDAVNVAGKFRQAVIGTPTQKAAMTKAIGASGVQGFDDIMEAVQLIAKDLRNRPASDTHAFQEVAKQQAEKAVPLLRSAGVVLAKAANPLEWATALEGIGRGRLLQDNAVKIAQSLTDSRKIAKLAELRKLKPTPERAIAVLSIAGLGIPLDDVTTRTFSPDVVPQASPGR